MNLITLKNNDIQSFDKIKFVYPFENRSYNSIPDKVVENTRDLYQKIINLNKKNEENKRLSNTDQLTQIDNRKGIYEKIGYHLQEIHRKNKKILILSIIDIDNFKKINDIHGHTIGDKVLVEITKIFKEETRGTDIIGRWGGEEFIIAFTNTNLEKGIEKLNSIKEKVQEDLNKRVLLKEKITFSGGIEAIEKKDFDINNIEESITNIIGDVDKLLLSAKNNGKNKIISIQN